MKKLIKKVNIQADAIEAYCTCSCSCSCADASSRYSDFKGLQVLVYHDASLEIGY